MLRLLALATIVLPLTATAQEPSVELVIASDVADREPVDPGNAFPEGTESVIAWARVVGLAGTTITFVWEYGESVDTVNLEIGGSPWRTWSRKTIPEGWNGEWSVRVTGTSGALAAATFTVGEESLAP